MTKSKQLNPLVFILLFTVTFFFASNIFSESSQKPFMKKIDKVVTENCQQSVQDSYRKTLAPLVSHLQGDSFWELALESVVPISCEIAQPAWRVSMSFSLGHYALSKGVKPATVRMLTKLTAKSPMGKNIYIANSNTFEKMESFGLDKNEAVNVSKKIITARLNLPQMETFSLLYLRERSSGQEPNQALANAALELPKIKRSKNSQKLFQEYSLTDSSWDEYRVKTPRLPNKKLDS